MSASTPASKPTVIDGRITRKSSNGLKLTFTQDGGPPLATGVQSTGDGRGAKLGVLLGFKNGGPGRHGLTFADGRSLLVQSREQQPTLITDSTGGEVAVVNRVGSGRDRSTALTADGSEVLHFSSDPVEPVTVDLFRAVLTDAAGADLGRLHVIRKNGGWASLSDVIDSAWLTYIWWNQAGQPLPVHILGTRLILLREVSATELDVLLAACVDLAIGHRPYIDEMN